MDRVIRIGMLGCGVVGPLGEHPDDTAADDLTP